MKNIESKVQKHLENFRKELFSLRNASGLTQQAVATSIGITTQSYQAYESGVAVPTLQNFIKLAIFFDVTLNDLLGI